VPGTLKIPPFAFFQHILCMFNVLLLPNSSLCPKLAGQSHHKLKSLNRECRQCGVSKLELLPEAISEGSLEEVTGKHYAHVGTGTVPHITIPYHPAVESIDDKHRG